MHIQVGETQFRKSTGGFFPRLKTCFATSCWWFVWWRHSGVISVSSHNNRYLMCFFERYDVFAFSKRLLNKLSSDTHTYTNWTPTFENISKNSIIFWLLSLYFISHFTQYLKIIMADIRYLWLQCSLTFIRWHEHRMEKEIGFKSLSMWSMISLENSAFAHV